MNVNEQAWRADVFDYLDQLRESGATNMFGAAPYLVAEFGIDASEARTLLQDWMRTFDERQAAKRTK